MLPLLLLRTRAQHTATIFSHATAAPTARLLLRRTQLVMTLSDSDLLLSDDALGPPAMARSPAARPRAAPAAAKRTSGSGARAAPAAAPSRAPASRAPASRAPAHKPSAALSDDDDSDESDGNESDGGMAHAVADLLKQVEKRKLAQVEKAHDKAHREREAAFKKAKLQYEEATAAAIVKTNKAKDDADKKIAKQHAVASKNLSDYEAQLADFDRELTTAVKKAKAEQQQLAGNFDAYKASGEQVCADLDKRVDAVVNKSTQAIRSALGKEAPIGDIIKMADQLQRRFEQGLA